MTKEYGDNCPYHLACDPFLTSAFSPCDHFAALDPRTSLHMRRPHKLWSFSTYPVPDVFFNHVLDSRELLMVKTCPKPVPCSFSSNTLPDSGQPHLGLCFKGSVLLLTGTPRYDSTAFYSRTQHLWSISVLPLSFSLDALFSFSCPKFPGSGNFISVLTVPFLCPLLPLPNPHDRVPSSPTVWSSCQ